MTRMAASGQITGRGDHRAQPIADGLRLVGDHAHAAALPLIRRYRRRRVGRRAAADLASWSSSMSRTCAVRHPGHQVANLIAAQVLELRRGGSRRAAGRRIIGRLRAYRGKEAEDQGKEEGRKTHVPAPAVQARAAVLAGVEGGYRVATGRGVEERSVARAVAIRSLSSARVALSAAT